MRHLAGTAFAVLVALPLGAGSARAMNEDAVPMVLEKAVDGFIRPGYHAFEQATGAMASAMNAFCAAPAEATYGEATASFDALVGAWSHIEIVRTGPVIDDHRFERILFYPDRKSIGLKQVQAAIIEKDETATDPGYLPEKSVAMQGLLALEFVLFGTQYETMFDGPETYRCRYGAAIAENIDTIAGELAAEWDAPDGVAAHWKNPGPDNPLFRTDDEALTALLGVLVHGMETVRDYRIEYFYRGEDGPNIPTRAIYWRSENTWPSILANLEGLQNLLNESDMVDLLDEDVRSIVSSINFLFASVEGVVGDMNPDIEVVLSDPDQIAKLDYLLINTKDLILRLNDRYGGAIGLGAGFSFSDGD
ncbi:imelysin family protein [Martelella mangrovi]|uniref:Lipoprotein n=1 Tax=Martelella mangrovi TaxID=1397477 RepID=A0ABV2IBT0_9HYPH